MDSTPVVIYSIDSLLLPAELFGLSPAPAPAPESDSPAPAPAPKAEAPAPEGDSPASSPPAPSTEAPANVPDADSPAGTPADLKSKKNGGERSGPVMMMFASSVVLSVISLVL